jgi:hypothetical protein
VPVFPSSAEQAPGYKAPRYEASLYKAPLYRLGASVEFQPLRALSGPDRGCSRAAGPDPSGRRAIAAIC